jgi:glutathione peroxidase-family protein
MMNIKLSKDFQKFLVDKTGRVIGVFGSQYNPMDPKIIDAITH